MQEGNEPWRRMAGQMGWVGQLLGEEFWEYIYENLRGLRPPGTPPVGGQPARTQAAAPAFPPVDIYLTVTEVVLTAAPPGLGSPEHVAVSLADGSSLVLEVFVAAPSPEAVVLQRERPAGYFARILQLPEPVRPEGARCRYADGLLEVRLARAQPGTGGGTVSLLTVEQPPHR